jgi:hypothetical protein
MKFSEYEVLEFALSEGPRWRKAAHDYLTSRLQSAESATEELTVGGTNGREARFLYVTGQGSHPVTQPEDELLRLGAENQQLKTHITHLLEIIASQSKAAATQTLEWIEVLNASSGSSGQTPVHGLVDYADDASREPPHRAG